ncbi:MAG: hypothetical protein ACKOBU_07535 [Gammaproteobacteria bacterium]
MGRHDTFQSSDAAATVDAPSAMGSSTAAALAWARITALAVARSTARFS